MCKLQHLHLESCILHMTPYDTEACCQRRDENVEEEGNYGVPEIIFL